MVPPGQQSQQQQLPSIRQLHPYLPLSSSGISQSLSPELSGYSYAPQYSPQIPQADATPSHTTGASQRDPAIYGIAESEADDLEQQSPPKKKRRRQALSCTGDYLALS